MFELLQKMLRIQQKQIIVIKEGGITVVGQEVDGLLSIPQEDMQIMNSSVTETSLVRFRSVSPVSCISVYGVLRSKNVELLP